MRLMNIKKRRTISKNKGKLVILYQEGYINSDHEPITEKE